MASVNSVEAEEQFNDEQQEPSGNILEVPLLGEGEAVTIDLDNDLPEDPSEICVLLENEQCGREYWMAIGIAYARNGHLENAVEVILKGLEVSSVKIPFYACLTWLYLRQVREAPNVVTEEQAAQGARTKADFHQLATDAGNKAFSLDPNWHVNILARGTLSIANGMFDNALTPFSEVLSQSSDTNLFANLGKARVLYHKKNYGNALKLYQFVLQSRPDMKPDPRIGIGLCYWQLDKKQLALQAWQRSLELQPKSIAANILAGLFFMDKAFSEDVASPDFAADYSTALKHIQAAYKINSHSPSAAVVLAGYLFSKKNIPAVLKLGEQVLQYSDVPSINSSGYFWIARAHHSQEHLEPALKYYSMASNSNPKNLLAKVGVGLVQMAQDAPEALLTFENITSEHPDSTEALFMLSMLYVKRAQQQNDKQHKDKAIRMLERYIRLTKSQNEVPPVEALLTLSKLSEETNVDVALSSLEESLKLLSDSNGDTEQSSLTIPGLHNNIGVINYFKGNYDAARSSFASARELLEKSTSTDQKKADMLVSTKYNIGRLEDAGGNYDAARALYTEILNDYPDYLDAQIRLGYLSLALGDSDGPELIQKLIDNHEDNLEVRALYGWYLRRQKRVAAKNMGDDVEQKHYKHSLMDYNKHDNYSLVAMGNLYLALAREIRVTNSSEQEKREKSYFKAAELFDKALQIDPQNAFAAQGIAIIFAETRRADLALHIFGKIRETLNDISVYINLGHCFTELKQYAKAIEVYEIALNRFKDGTDAQLFTLLGRVWYARGVSERNIDSLKVSLDYSKKALALAKNNLGLQFNVAFIQFQLAESVRRAPETRRTLVDIKEASEGLEEAITSLNDIAKSKYPPYPANDLEQRAVMGQNTVRKQLERAAEQQKEYENQAQTKIDEARKIQQAEKEKLEEEQRKKEERETERQNKLMEERRILQEQAREWTERAQEEAAKEEELVVETKKSKRAAREEGEKRTGKKKASKKQFKSTSDVSSSEEEEIAIDPELESESEALFGEEDEVVEEADAEVDVEAPDAVMTDTDVEGEDSRPVSSREKRRASKSNGTEVSKKRRVTRTIADDEDDEDEDQVEERNGDAKGEDVPEVDGTKQVELSNDSKDSPTKSTDDVEFDFDEED